MELDELTNTLKQVKNNKSLETENKVSLFAEGGQLKQDIVKTVVNKEAESHLGMLSKSHSKAK